jgi:hypothetical protein
MRQTECVKSRIAALSDPSLTAPAHSCIIPAVGIAIPCFCKKFPAQSTRELLQKML